MKKIVCTFLCAVLAMSLLLCGCLVDDPANNVVTGETQIVTNEQGESVIVEVSSTLGAALYDNDVAQLELIDSGTFYFKGTMTESNGEVTPMEIAAKDGNSYMGSSLEGIDIGFLHTGNDYYMMYPDGECALLMDEAVCSTFDMDINDLSFDASSLSLGEVADDLLVNTADALVDTTIATCRTYRQPNGNFVKTYISDGQLIRLQQVSAEGVVLSTLDIEILTDVVPADKSTLPSSFSVYNGTVGMMSFMMKFASSVDIDSLIG